jgi:hypothetical protein
MSPNIWHNNPRLLQLRVPTPNLQCLRCYGSLEPQTIASWLQKEVGLTSYDVESRFAPYCLRAFDTDALTNPRSSFTNRAPPERSPNPTNYSLPEFGDRLEWTSGHGPRGPPINARAPATASGSSILQGTADTADASMEG